MDDLVVDLEDYSPQDYSKEIFQDRYAFTEQETWPEACLRVAKQMAAAETSEKNKKYEDRFYEAIVKNLFVPGGRIWANSGRPNPQLLNCFVLENQLDSKEGWANISYEMILTSMTGGGCGIDFSDVRPRGASISTQKGPCPGSVELMKLINGNGEPVRAGGSRRAALMFSLDLDHPDLEEFLNAKLNKEELNLANVSVRSKYTTKFIEAVKNNADWELSWKGRYKKNVKAKDIWDIIVKNSWDSAEPGFLNWELTEKESNTYYIENLVTTNPCLTGETLVYTADGRGDVSIRQLAEEGKDIPVFCLNSFGDPVIRIMRNPRITGFNEPIYKVTLNNGKIIRATKNHKIMLLDGTYKELKDLQPGDSLRHISLENKTLKDIHPTVNSNSQAYKWIKIGDKKRYISEHRLIAEHFYNQKIPKGCVVHHKDCNAQNNSPNNLEVMTKEAHDEFHRRNMLGDKNPMKRARVEWSQEKWDNYRKNMSTKTSRSKNGNSSGVTNEELKNHAIILTKRLKRKFSYCEWEVYALKNNLPISFSGSWRKSHLNGGIVGLAKWAAFELGFEWVNEDLRVIKSFRDALSQGYDAEIIGYQVCINKRCEVCNKPFQVFYQQREIGICGNRCAANKINSDPEVKAKAIQGMKEFWKKKNGRTKRDQLKIYKDLEFELQRAPMRKEWQISCKEKGIPCHVGKNNPFKTYKELQMNAEGFNFKVVSIEFDGYEDVYNGTVDEFHNFMIGGFESIDELGRKKFNYINNLQCGEIGLSSHDACNLGHLVLFRFIKNGEVDWHLLAKTIRTGVRFLDNVLSVNCFPLPQMKEKTNRLRRIGLGTTGLADMLALLGYKYGSEESIKFIDKLYRFISKQAYEASVMLAIEKGPFSDCKPELHIKSGYMKRMPKKIKDLVLEHGIRNCAILTIAPTGTVSIISGNCSGGIEPMFAPAYERRYWEGEIRRAQFVFHPLFAQFMREGKDVSHFVAAKDLTVKEHMEVQKVIQKHIDNAVSKTINLPKDYPLEEMSKVWLEYLPYLKGTTFYREGSRNFVDKDGNEEEPPLKEIPLDVAIKEFTKQDTIIERVEIDCPNGSCEI